MTEGLSLHPLLSQYSVVLKALRSDKIHQSQERDSAMSDSFFIFNGTIWSIFNGHLKTS